MTPELYTITLTRGARKDLAGLDAVVARRVTTAIGALSENPRPPGCLRIVSEDGLWRIRVGDYRIAYTLDDRTRAVVIARVSHRSDFYD